MSVRAAFGSDEARRAPSAWRRMAIAVFVALFAISATGFSAAAFSETTSSPAALATQLLPMILPATNGAAPQVKKRANDPASCPYCQNDPALLKAAGLVSHGGFPFGKKGNDTNKVDDFMAANDIRWVETEHFRIGFGLGSYKVKLEDKKKILAELTRLKLVLPKVVPDTGILDPWLRTHIYAQRCEDIYKRFIQIIDGGTSKFADGSGTWEGRYAGEGPYLGMKEKYEALVLPSEAAHVTFLLENAGLRIRNSQRWHFVDRGTITIMMHAEQGQLRNDAPLHGHFAFNLAHNLFDGLNHYSYDTPVWIHEGLAHFMEREIDPDHNSFDSGEGAVADMTSKGNWKPEVLKLINSGEASRMAELMAVKSYSELKLVHHYTTWSMIEFLITTKPAEFAKFVFAIKSNYDAQGLPTGSNLPDWHRKQFKEIFGWTYAEFDEAWRAWAQVAYGKPAAKDKDKEKEKVDPNAKGPAPAKPDPAAKGGVKEDPEGGNKPPPPTPPAPPPPGGGG